MMNSQQTQSFQDRLTVLLHEHGLAAVQESAVILAPTVVAKSAQTHRSRHYIAVNHRTQKEIVRQLNLSLAL